MFYTECDECQLEDGSQELSSIVFHQSDPESTATTTNICLCADQAAAQPPEEIRGEIARALLYMDLRYGTPTSASDVTSGLLKLTDCHRNGFASDTTTMGYFSKLVEWHLNYPPTQAEIDRNTKTCKYYQGNRNIFVDFPEDAWTLLNFEAVEQDTCATATRSPAEYEQEALEQEEIQLNDGDVSQQENTTAGRADTDYGCGDLLPGDVNFYTVTTGQDGGNGDSFGLVTLIDLPAGMELYVTDNAWTGSTFQAKEGTMKVGLYVMLLNAAATVVLVVVIYVLCVVKYLVGFHYGI
jgi:hypothetical protein